MASRIFQRRIAAISQEGWMILSRAIRGAVWRAAAVSLGLPVVPAAAQQVTGSATPVKAVAAAPLAAKPEAALSPSAFMALAARISQGAAAGDYSKIYNDASPIMKAAISRDQFERQLSEGLKGAVAEADWQDVRQFIVPPSTDKGAIAAGHYVSVTLVVVAGGVTSGASPARTETLSFHHETDGSWRLAGFSIGILTPPSSSAHP